MNEKDFGSNYSYISNGCKYCKIGSKMVLFITGLCYQNCFYCPIGIHKKNKDIIYANEYQITNKQETLDVSLEMNALGVGITGGEPLLKFNRVIDYINYYKKEFGKSYHIHLYTSTAPSLVQLKKLAKHGLDEIRLHPPYYLWKHQFNYNLYQYYYSLLNS